MMTPDRYGDYLFKGITPDNKRDYAIENISLDNEDEISDLFHAHLISKNDSTNDLNVHLRIIKCTGLLIVNIKNNSLIEQISITDCSDLNLCIYNITLERVNIVNTSLRSFDINNVNITPSTDNTVISNYKETPGLFILDQSEVSLLQIHNSNIVNIDIEGSRLYTRSRDKSKGLVEIKNSNIDSIKFTKTFCSETDEDSKINIISSQVKESLILDDCNIHGLLIRNCIEYPLQYIKDLKFIDTLPNYVRVDKSYIDNITLDNSVDVPPEKRSSVK